MPGEVLGVNREWFMLMGVITGIGPTTEFSSVSFSGPSTKIWVRILEI